jgi:hypothetical protein
MHTYREFRHDINFNLREEVVTFLVSLFSYMKTESIGN